MSPFFLQTLPPLLDSGIYSRPISRHCCWLRHQPVWEAGNPCLIPTLLAGCTALSHSVVSDSATPRTVAAQVPLSLGFSREEYWSGLPCSSPGNLPNPGIKPRSPALQADSLPAELPGIEGLTVRGGSGPRQPFLVQIYP